MKSKEKNREYRIGVRLNADEKTTIENVMAETDLSMSYIIRQAIKTYVQNIQKTAR
jgi:predicted transcriptional regulator